MKFTTKRGTGAVDQLDASMNHFKLTLVWTHTFYNEQTSQLAAVHLDKNQTLAVAAQLHNFIHSRAIIVGEHGSEKEKLFMYTEDNGRALHLDGKVDKSQMVGGTYTMNKADAKVLLDYINANREPIDQ